MFHKVFNSSNNKSGLDQQLEESISFNLSDENLSQDDLAGENIARTEEAQQAIWKGIQSEKKGQLKQAISYYRSAIEEDPESAKAYQLLSSALKKMRDKRQLEQKQEDEESDKQTNKGNTTIQRETSQRKTLSEAGLIESENRNSSVDLNSRSLESAVRTYEVDTKSNLIVPANSNPEENPDFSNVDLVPMSNSSRHSNIFDRSSQQSNKIILLPEVRTTSSGEIVVQDNMEAAQVYVEQALAYIEQKQWQDSINACQEALRICPTIGKAYKVWGNSLQKSGDIAGAIGIYAKALEVQPDMAEIYCNLGSIYANKKNWKQAIEHYQKSSQIDAQNSTPYRNLARVWDQLGEYERSTECFFRAIEIEPTLLSAQNHFELAGNLVEEDSIERAIACYKYCIQIDPKFTNAYVKLADALEHNGQTETALFYYKKLAKLQGSNSNLDGHSKSRQLIRGFLFGQSLYSISIVAECNQLL